MIPVYKGYLQTGQQKCYDTAGHEISCAGSGEDGEFGAGIPRPPERFARQGDVV